MHLGDCARAQICFIVGAHAEGDQLPDVNLCNHFATDYS